MSSDGEYELEPPAPTSMAVDAAPRGPDNLDLLFGESSSGVSSGSGTEESERLDRRLETSSEDESALEDLAEPQNAPMAPELDARRLVPPSERGYTSILMKLPGFMRVHKEKFDGPSFMAENDHLKGSDVLGEDVSLKALSAIRWRRSKDGEPISNAQVIRWSDGSATLAVGSEQFEISVHPLLHEHNYLFSRHANIGCMEGQAQLEQRYNVHPSVSQTAYRRAFVLGTSAGPSASKDVRVKMAVTSADPEKEKQRMIKLQQDKIRERRKVTARRRNLEQKSYVRSAQRGLSTAFLEEAEEDENSEYEEDFIDDREPSSLASEEENSEDVTEESEAELTDQNDEDEGEDDESPRRPKKRKAAPVLYDEE